MQSVMRDGTLGEVCEFTEGTLRAQLVNPEVDHVDVFPGTKENIKRRRGLVGKHVSRLKYRPSGGFKKAPAISKGYGK